MLLEETPAVLSLVKLCEEHGYTYHWTSGQTPHLVKRARKLIAIYHTMYHLWFLENSEFFLYAFICLVIIFITGVNIAEQRFSVRNRGVKTPVPERSGSTSEEVRGDPLRESTETENKKQKSGARRSTKICIA